jgi:hypothetical protein
MAVDIAPNQVWRGKGAGREQRIRILELRGDRVSFERIEGSAEESLHKAHTTERVNIEAAFEYAGETMDTFMGA